MTRLHTDGISNCTQKTSRALLLFLFVILGFSLDVLLLAALLASCLTCWITFGPRVQYLEMYVCCLSTLVIGTW